ncbi:MAG: DUF2946 family protein [Pirellulales bacterium]
MVGPRKHPLLTALALAAYLLAVTAGGLMHDHAHHAAPGETAHCGHHHHHSADYLATERDGPTPPVHHDDDCAVCRFLAQPVAPVTAIEADAHHERSIPLALATSDDPVRRPLDFAHARAPPLVG